MGYALQLGAWSSVFAVPGALVDRYIKTADGDQLKVILWLLRNNGRSYSAEEIGEAVGLNGAQAERAVQFWVQNGLLQKEEAPLSTTPQPLPLRSLHQRLHRPRARPRRAACCAPTASTSRSLWRPPPRSGGLWRRRSRCSAKRFRPRFPAR